MVVCYGSTRKLTNTFTQEYVFFSHREKGNSALAHSNNSTWRNIQIYFFQKQKTKKQDKEWDKNNKIISGFWFLLLL